MSGHDHRWSFVKDATQCRRGPRACEAPPSDREGWRGGLRPAERKAIASNRLQPLALVCWDCRLCWTCAAHGSCPSRRRPGYPGDPNAVGLTDDGTEAVVARAS